MSFDPVSYAMGKQAGGGGGGVTVEALSVSENGTYTAPTGKAYSPVSVNVGAPTVDESKPIRFYDYDGTPLYSYDYAELAELTELPAQPEHEGLTATGWNWTLAELKAENAPVIVGGHYRTTDGRHKIYITVANAYSRKLALALTVSGTIEVDWGDGTKEVYSSGNNIHHEYTQNGKYCIAIDAISGIFKPAQRILRFTDKYNVNTSASRIIDKIEGGNPDTSQEWGVTFNSTNVSSIAIPSKDWICSKSNIADCIKCYSLRFLSVPFGDYGTRSLDCKTCSSMHHISLPKEGVKVSQGVFNGCASLQEINLPAETTSIPTSLFDGCTSLQNVKIPVGVTSIGQQAFNGCILITGIYIPTGITSIGNTAFGSTQNMIVCDFTDWTIADLDACSFGTNIFQSIKSETSILFRYKSIADHAATITNLAAYAAYMTYEEDDT